MPMTEGDVDKMLSRLRESSDGTYSKEDIIEVTLSSITQN